MNFCSNNVGAIYEVRCRNISSQYRTSIISSICCCQCIVGYSSCNIITPYFYTINVENNTIIALYSNLK